MTLARHLGRAGSAVVLAITVGAFAGVGPSLAGTSGRGSDATDGRIVFDNGTTGQIYTVNPDGTALVQVTHVGANHVAIMPVWSPDSSHIVFMSNPRGDNDLRVFMMRRDGTGIRQVNRDPIGFADFTPAITPDGTTIVFSRCRPDPPGGCALFAVQSDGMNKRALTRYGSGVHERSDFWPDVSPDGTRIAFERFDDSGISSQVWLMNVDGTDAHPITAPALEAGVPRWTPDGQHLLVTSNFVHLGEDVYRIRPDGTHPHRVTHARFPFNNQAAVPSPSGEQVAFVSDRAYPQPLAGNDLFVMRSDGSGQHSIATGTILGSDWGSAPALSASAGTPRAQLAPARPRSAEPVRRHVLDRLPWAHSVG